MSIKKGCVRIPALRKSGLRILKIHIIMELLLFVSAWIELSMVTHTFLFSICDGGGTLGLELY